MSCLVENWGKTYLLRTGSDGRLVLSNMGTLGKNPEQVEAAVLSREHGDHIGGPWEFPRARSKQRVQRYLSESFPGGLTARAERAGARVIDVNAPREITSGAYTTGRRGPSIKDQALVVKASAGVVVVTGCSHPGIVECVKRAMRIGESEVVPVIGSFRLMRSFKRQVERVIDELKHLGGQGEALDRVNSNGCCAMRDFG
jgi:7,8-dihydropterin-6-yl-methyl-4-(beta-D-ribofuranosyl)aminobenzene 5'-phosphate synthase